MVKKISFKIFIIFSSGGHFIEAEQNGLFNFVSGHYEEHLCEVILKMTLWLKG